MKISVDVITEVMANLKKSDAGKSLKEIFPKELVDKVSFMETLNSPDARDLELSISGKEVLFKMYDRLMSNVKLDPDFQFTLDYELTNIWIDACKLSIDGVITHHDSDVIQMFVDVVRQVA